MTSLPIKLFAVFLLSVNWLPCDGLRDFRSQPRDILVLEPGSRRESALRSACNMTVVRDGSILLSHDYYYQFYLKNVTCYVRIVAPPKKRVSVIFDDKFQVDSIATPLNTLNPINSTNPNATRKPSFQITCTDSLRMYDGELTTNKAEITGPNGVCGYEEPNEIRTTNNIMTLVWKTQGNGNFTGFMMFVVFFHEKKCRSFRNEFPCQNRKCINRMHTCDAVLSCGANETTDEDDKICMGRYEKIFPPPLTLARDGKDTEPEFIGFVRSPIGMILGWVLFFLLLVSITFVGCLSICYILVCGMIGRGVTDQEFNFYTFRKNSVASKKDRSSSISSTCPICNTISGAKYPSLSGPVPTDNAEHTPEATLLKPLTKTQALNVQQHQRRATDPLSNRHSYDISSGPRRYTAPADYIISPAKDQPKPQKDELPSLTAPPSTPIKEDPAGKAVGMPNKPFLIEKEQFIIPVIKKSEHNLRDRIVGTRPTPTKQIDKTLEQPKEGTLRKPSPTQRKFSLPPIPSWDNRRRQ